MTSPECTKSDTSLNGAAQFLAAFVDQIAGDYPLVSGMPGTKSRSLLWQYGAHHFLVHFGSREECFPGQDELAEGSPTNIYVSSIERALDLIRLTEKIRQKVEYPHISLGCVPGTGLR